MLFPAAAAQLVLPLQELKVERVDVGRASSLNFSSVPDSNISDKSIQRDI